MLISVAIKEVEKLSIDDQIDKEENHTPNLLCQNCGFVYCVFFTKELEFLEKIDKLECECGASDMFFWVTNKYLKQWRENRKI